MSIAIRRAKSDDATTIVCFNTEMALETEGLELSAPTVSAGVRRLLDDPARGFYFVAERSGEIVGQLMITLEWSDWRNGWWWWIQSVYVSPAARRSGVYSMLYAHARSEAQEAGAVGMRLYVDRRNTDAQSTYVALGMRESGYLFYELEFDGLS